jgi:2'-5' RNA ligase
VAEQPDYSDSCMLAIYPPADIVAALAIPGGLAPADLHVTVAYTGSVADVGIKDLVAAAIDAAQQVGPFTAQVSGSGRFTGGEQDVAVALIDAPELEDLRAAARSALEAHGIELPGGHGYTAHATISYLAAADPDPVGRLAPLGFLVGALSVVHGTTRIDIPLRARAETRAAPPGLAGRAREAYAEGWARTGGPMTDRVKAGCVAAVEVACAHPGEPGILEATLRLGSLEGTWARVFQRREELLAKQAATVIAAWREATANLDAAAMVRQVRGALSLGESTRDDATARARQIARDAALNLLAWLPASRAWQGLRNAMRHLLQSGRAEGVADAIAISGQAVGHLGMDFDLAFTHAYDALANLGALWADADGWLGKMLGRAADDLGRALADLAENGASYEEMLAAAGSILDGIDGDAVSFIVDWALQTALSQGALALYASEGVTAVSWITAGDSSVCASCESNEANSPYAPSDFPSMPDHPRCRCAPSADLDLSSFAQYFTN